MTTRQRLELKLSEQRQRLNELAGLENPAESDLEELRALQGQHASTEEQYRAAVTAEGEAAETRAGGSEDSEGREVRSLIGRAELRSYVQAALSGSPVEGAESELRAAFNVTADHAIPWAALDPSPFETRADAVTAGPSDVGVSQSAILGRVFARSATAALGVGMPSVPVGERLYPIVTAGATAAMVAADGAKEAEAATITTTSIEPTRLQARYLFRREDTARLAGIESALRSDLSSAMADAMDSQVIAGDGDAPNVGGFLTTEAKGGLAAVTAPTAVATYSGFLTALASGVDGKYASSLGECSMVFGPETYRLAATVVGNDETGLGYLRRESGGVMASANIPDASSMVQDAILARRGSMNLNSSVG